MQKIYIGTEINGELRKIVSEQNPDHIYILVDSITKKIGLPFLQKNDFLHEAQVIEILPGDDHKGTDSLISVWKYLSENGASRKSLLLNFGGGMVTDLGGFAASTFKRGMSYVNIPTTLLGAVDAAVGGKTGINFNGLKNEIGIINPAQAVLINIDFFKTLNEMNFLSGYAEIIKHGLISSKEKWNHVLRFELNPVDYDALPALLEESIQIKESIVLQDPDEKSIRKALNFGHTIGHAFESYALRVQSPVLHGYAVAWGMIAELYLSYKKTGLPKELLQQAVSYIKGKYGAFAFSCKEYETLYEYMTHDKKNEGKGKILFSLLSNIGEVQINVDVEKKEIFDALDFYRDSVGL